MGMLALVVTVGLPARLLRAFGVGLLCVFRIGPLCVLAFGLRVLRGQQIGGREFRAQRLIGSAFRRLGGTWPGRRRKQRQSLGRAVDVRRILEDRRELSARLGIAGRLAGERRLGGGTGEQVDDVHDGCPLELNGRRNAGGPARCWSPRRYGAVPAAPASTARVRRGGWRGCRTMKAVSAAGARIAGWR